VYYKGVAQVNSIEVAGEPVNYNVTHVYISWVNMNYKHHVATLQGWKHAYAVNYYGLEPIGYMKVQE
jgi:hypothetical protein